MIYLYLFMKGKTQPMKRLLLLLPIIMASGCKSTNYEISYPSSFNSHKVSNNVYFNVYYTYVFDEHAYRVYLDENDGEHYKIVPPKNVYELNIGSVWKNDIFIRNEYFVSTNELFIYQ